MYEMVLERYATLLFVIVMVGTYRYILGLSIERIKKALPYAMAVSAVILSFLPYSENGDMLGVLLLFLVVRGLFFYSAEKKRYRNSLVFWPVLMIAMMPSMIVELFAQASLLESIINSEAFWTRSILDLVTIILLSMLAYCDHKWSYTRRIGTSERYLIGVVSTVIVLGSIAVTEMNQQSRLGTYGRAILFAAGAMFCILVVAVILLLMKGYKAAYYMELNQMNEQSMEELLKHFEAYQAAQEDTRRIRHDMKNHFACIRLLFEEGKEEELREYLSDITRVTEQLSFPISTGNTIVDAILCEKAHIVEAEQIRFQVEGTIPSDIDLKPMDWCTIFANATDNAIEALRKMPDSTEKVIKIRIKTNRNFLSIQFQNVCGKNVNIRKGMVKTTKREKEKHGFGILNIKRTADSYGGDIKIECSMQEAVWKYQLQVMLPLNRNHLSQNNDDSSQNPLQGFKADILGASKSYEGDVNVEYNKKHMNRVGLMAVSYTALMIAGSIVYVLGVIIAHMVKHPEAINMTEKQMEQFIDPFLNGGTIYLVSIAIALTAVVLYRRKKLFTYDLVTVNRPCSVKSFGKAFVCLMAIQFILVSVYMGAESVLNHMGYSIMGEMESASAQSTTISMFLYAGILGPIAEEIVFRGAILRSLERYGKVFAIIISSLLFGLFHGNLLQGFFAFFVGIVLAYITEEYSIKWAMLLHMLNNTLGDVIGYLTSGMDENAVGIAHYIVYGIMFVAALVLIIRNREQIKQYIAKNPTANKSYQLIFTRFWIILYIVVQIIVGVSGIERLSTL